MRSGPCLLFPASFVAPQASCFNHWISLQPSMIVPCSFRSIQEEPLCFLNFEIKSHFFSETLPFLRHSIPFFQPFVLASVVALRAVGCNYWWHACLAHQTVRKETDCDLFNFVSQQMVQCLVPTTVARTSSCLLNHYSVPCPVPSVLCVLTDLILSTIF